MNTAVLALLLTAAPLLLAADQPHPDPAQVLAGRYYSQFPDALVSGEKYTGENIVEVVPVASHAAYVRVHLDYFNGHTCGLYGVAKSYGDALVFRDLKQDLENQVCVLTVRRVGKSLSLDDGGGTCRSYCGARGSLSQVELPYGNKRPIRYLRRLKQSPQYRDALTEWQTGKRPQEFGQGR